MIITRCWQYASEPHRIHYLVEQDGVERHLFVDQAARGGLFMYLLARIERRVPAGRH